MRSDRVGVENPARVAAVRATGLLERGPEESFDRITQLAGIILRTSMTYLTVVGEVFSALKGAPESAALCGPDGTFTVPAREAACQLVVDSGEEVVVPDTAADARLRDLTQVKAFNVAAWLGVPIVDPDGHVLGNLCGMDSRVRHWTDTEVSALRTLAASVSDVIALRLAAQTLQVYAEQTAELAMTLQQSLLPTHLPRIPGITVATRFAPGGSGVDVLGDFYDVVRSEGGGFGVVIGDVCGKGAAAARTTALARSAVRTAAHSESDPVAVLATVNDVLLEWFGAGRSFVTAAYATFTRDEERWDVRLAGAGHPPGFVRHADGRVVELAGGGRVLGLTPEHPTGLDVFFFFDWESMVIYTDGITEARDPAGAQLDEHGVAAALAGAPSPGGALELADTLVEAAHRHTGHACVDDIAVVVLQVPPEP